MPKPVKRVSDVRRRLAEDHWRPLLEAQFPGRGFD